MTDAEGIRCDSRLRSLVDDGWSVHVWRMGRVVMAEATRWPAHIKVEGHDVEKAMAELERFVREER